MIINNAHAAELRAPARQISGKVELHSGSALLASFLPSGALKSFVVTREAGKKFFGYGIGQKLRLELLDRERSISVEPGHVLKLFFGVGGEYIAPPCPEFTAAEIVRDENTNALTITAHCPLASAAAHTVAELGLTSYTVRQFATAAAGLLGLSAVFENVSEELLALSYSAGANFGGSEPLRGALDALAEVSACVYFVRGSELVFRGLDGTGAAVLDITKADYTTLNSSGARQLAAICSASELGDNITASTAATGETQYLRNNPFIELREDAGEIVEAVLAAAGSLALGQYNLTWRGNYLLELGDKLQLTAKDGSSITSFYLGGELTYNGGLSEVISWEWEDSAGETPGNPASLGDALKQTFARVDKANRQIELVAAEAAANAEELAALRVDTGSISASVSRMEAESAEAIDALSDDIARLTESVETKITPEQVEVAIKKEMDNGTNKVVTSTGYTLDDEGLKISKTGSEMSTRISDNGMTVYHNEEAMLTANSAGVEAVNLHAKTYLIVGKNSRFEDYGERTGCFWIGG